MAEGNCRHLACSIIQIYLFQMPPAKEKQAAVMAKAREVVFKFLEPLPIVAAAQIKSIDCLSVSMFCF